VSIALVSICLLFATGEVLSAAPTNQANVRQGGALYIYNTGKPNPSPSQALRNGNNPGDAFATSVATVNGLLFVGSPTGNSVFIFIYQPASVAPAGYFPASCASLTPGTAGGSSCPSAGSFQFSTSDAVCSWNFISITMI
jgi:hypothetical protein